MANLNANRRMELDAKLRCPACQGVPFLVYRRQNAQPDGTLLSSYEHVLWPNGSGVMPPLHGERLVCPHCQTELRREAP